MKNVFFEIQRKCLKFCEEHSLRDFVFNMILCGIFLLLIILWLIFFPSLNKTEEYYVPGIEKQALIEDAGENWKFILDNSTIEYPKNQINPMYEAGQTVNIITDKNETEILNFCNYTLDGVLVFDKDGQKIETASNIGYDKFIQFEEITKMREENEVIKNSPGYSFPINTLKNILILGLLLIINAFLSFYLDKEMGHL